MYFFKNKSNDSLENNLKIHNAKKLITPIKNEGGKSPDILDDLPSTLLIGDFHIVVEKYIKIGTWNEKKKVLTGVTGNGWIKFTCGGLPSILIDPKSSNNIFKIKTILKVVPTIRNLQTEISLEKAQLIKPGIKLGDNLELEFNLSIEELQDYLQSEIGTAEYVFLKKGNVFVEFEDVTIQIVDSKSKIGRVVKGNAIYPAKFKYPQIIKLDLNGFTAFIKCLNLSPIQATAKIELFLPKNIASDITCKKAKLDLGKTTITPNCEFYVEKVNDQYGPWIVGDTGMIIQGRGFIADFSKSLSPLQKPSTWKGVVLKSGDASGEKISPTNSNTGFMTGKYAFNNGIISENGLNAEFNLKEEHVFKTINPFNYTIKMGNGKLNILKSRIVSGIIQQGEIEFPTKSICKDSVGNPVVASIASLIIKNNLDIVGKVTFGNQEIAWGELTNVGEEIIVWSGLMGEGYLYLQSDPMKNFSPDTGSDFIGLSLENLDDDEALEKLESLGVFGVTVNELENITIFSRDPVDPVSGEVNPIQSDGLVLGWLNIGNSGVNGELRSKIDENLSLGNKTLSGYVGQEPFSTFIHRKKMLLGKLVESSVYESGLYGEIKLKEPCNMVLAFTDMGLTSTAHLVGGDVILPEDGVKLDYWKLDLVPTGNPDKAGVISVRTGRLIFIAAGILEPIHFFQPFRLTWGEILADGNIGELFFDYNNYGQTFDGFQYSPHHISLSKHDSIPKNSKLLTCGSVSFNFFGESFVNIIDSRYDASEEEPYFGRFVTVPKYGETTCPQTDLRLFREYDKLAVFDFPDVNVNYNEESQDGFIGMGSTQVSFFGSIGLEAAIQLKRGAIDIRLSAKETHDLNFGLISDLGSMCGMSGIAGCVRIVGPTLKRFAISGYVENSVDVTKLGIISPRSGSIVEVLLSITPSSCTFMASGGMFLTLCGSQVEVYGTAHLAIDYNQKSAAGDLIGVIDCHSILAGLEAEGQATWYIDPWEQYLQGRLAMKLCGFLGGTLEGGIFLGTNCPREKAWVLFTTGSPRFGISIRTLPKKLTGFYGYGRLAQSIDIFVLSGGYEIFMGMGVFTDNIFGPLLWANVVCGGGFSIHGEVLGGLLSARASANLSISGPFPLCFEGKVTLEACALWVMCTSIALTAGFDDEGFYIFE